MSTLIPPRYELKLVDDNGHISREWYKFLVLMAKSIGPSLNTDDDIQTRDNMDIGALEGLALRLQQKVRNIEHSLLLTETDLPKQQDTSLLGWWPGDSK